MSLIITAEKDLHYIATGFANVHQAGDILLLEGDIGTGKTTYTRYLMKVLEADIPVTSPTFTLVQEYDARLPVSHIDLYRLDDEEALVSLDIQKYLTQTNGLTCIEWAEKLGSFYPPSYMKLTFHYPQTNEGVSEERRIDFSCVGSQYHPYQDVWDSLIKKSA